MRTFSIRHALGFSWFSLLVLATATIVISTDAEVGSIGHALSMPNLPGIFLFALPIALIAAPSFILFRQRRWWLGIGAASALSILCWLILQTIQITDAPLTIRESLLIAPRVAIVMGGWTVLISLPSALLFNQE